MSEIKPTYREPEGIDNWNTVPPRVVNALQVEERERRRKAYEALRSMLVVMTGLDQWDAYTYSELLNAARNALASELDRIK